MTTVNQAVARQEQPGVIEQYRADFAAVLPTHVSADQWVRLTQGVFRRNGALQQVLNTNPGSVLTALLDCARLGLEIGDTYHLVPMGGEVVGIADYTGLIELIYRAGAVRSVKTEIVYSRDLVPDPADVDPTSGRPRPRFAWEPSYMDVPHHRPDWFSDRGDMIGAYAYAVMVDGSPSQVVMRNRAEIEKVKAVSKTARSATSPWNVWPDRMWKKTVIRELAKFVPTSAEFRMDLARAAKAGNPEVGPLHAASPPVPLDDGDFVDGEVIAEGTTEVSSVPSGQPTEARRTMAEPLTGR